MKRPKREKVFEAERQLRENSIGWLRRELDTLRGYQQKSFEPEVWETRIAEIEDKLKNPQDQGLKDFLAFLLVERGKLSWQRVGDQLYRDVKGKVARRLRARRAWTRANSRLESEPPGNSVAEAILWFHILYS